MLDQRSTLTQTGHDYLDFAGGPSLVRKTQPAFCLAADSELVA